MVGSRLESISGKSVAIQEIRLRNSALQFKGVEIKDKFFSLRIKNLLLRPGIWDLLHKRKVEAILLEKPILRIYLRSETKPYNFGILPTNLPRKIKIVQGEIILPGEKKKIKISGLDAKIAYISQSYSWNEKISGRLNEIPFSLVGEINPLREKISLDLQLIFEKSMLLRGKVKVVGYLKNGNSFTGGIVLKNLNFRIPDYPSLKNLNAHLRIRENNVLGSRINIEKIDAHRFCFYNVMLPISYSYDEDMLKVENFSYYFSQGKGTGNLTLKGLISKKNRYSFFTKISGLDLRELCATCKQPNLISGILQCRLKITGEKRKFPEVSASFFTEKRRGIEQTISFRAVKGISAFAGGSSINGKLMDYPYQKLAGSFNVKNRDFTLRGDIARGGKQYLLLGPFFGRALNILIDPVHNTISIDDLRRRLKRALTVSSRAKIRVGGGIK